MPTSEDRESMVSEAVPIRRVSELTGVNSVTLRAWERRYGLLKPLRTAKGHRLYRPEDIARVEAIQRWLARGVAVGQVRALLDQGAKSVTAYITHGVLSGGAVARVNKSALKELVISDSIQPTDAAKDSDRIRILPIAPLLGEAIRRIADESSVSSLFD